MTKNQIHTISKADKCFEKGKKLAQKAQYTESSIFFNKSKNTYQKAQNWAKFVESKCCLAENYYYQTNYEQALQGFEQTLSESLIYLGEYHKQTADIYHNIGACYGELGKYQLQLQFYQKALNIRYTLFPDGHKSIATSYNNIGYHYQQKGDYDMALSYYEKSLALHLVISGEQDILTALSYSTIGTCYDAKGFYDKAINFYKQSLAIQIVLLGENHPNIAQIYNNTGVIYGRKGDYKEQLNYYQQAILIFQRVFGEQHAQTGSCYANIAWSYSKQKKFDFALMYYQKSLAIVQPIYGTIHPNVARLYNNIGSCFLEQQIHKEALSYYQKSLSIRQQLFGKESHPDISKSYESIGYYFFHQKQYEKAIGSYIKASDVLQKIIQTKHPSIADYQLAISKCYFEQKKYTPALYHCQQALIQLIPGYNNKNYYNIPNVTKNYNASTLLKTIQHKTTIFHTLYIQKNDLQKLIHSFNYCKLSVQLINQIRKTYKTEDAKLLLAEYASVIYQQAMCVSHILFQKTQKYEYITAMFCFSELNKSIILLLGIKDIEAQNLGNIPKKQLDNLKEWQVELTYLKKQIQKEQCKTNSDNKLLQRWQSKYFNLTQKYQNLIDNLEKNYPQYYQLKYAIQTTNIFAIQTKLNAQTALIEFFVTEEKIYTFCITKKSRQIYTIAYDNSLQTAIKQFTNIIANIDIKNYVSIAYKLYQLLIDPLSEHLTDIKKLVFIPENELLQLPFEALLCTPYTQKIRHISFPKLDYLLKHYQISYHYSATLWENTRKAILSKKNNFSNQFVGLAPVEFDNNLPKLYHSAQEVKQVADLFEKKKKSTKVLLNGTAHIANFKKYVSSSKNILVSSHGMIHDQQPHLSGIVFGMKKELILENMLYLSDAYHLDIQADLLVLSICKSGIGQLAKGEGMMSMNRGFMFSGCHNILFTLFNIPDISSVALTKHFFSYILEGNNYTTALQKAKLDLIHQAYLTPKDWAAFVLIS